MISSETVMSSKLEEAINFATRKHKGQKYGKYPYTYHLSKVVGVLERFIPDVEEHLVIAGWLHDVVEDTTTTREDVEKLFGEVVAATVYAVTNEAGVNRRERHENTYPKIRESKFGLMVKLADRIANVEESSVSNKPLFKMYKKEHSNFKKELKINDDLILMWNYLDKFFIEG